MTESPASPRRLYGRRLGRPLKGARRNVLDALLPELEIDPTNMGELFSRPVEQTWLEIGFGNGEHVISLMKAHPSYGFIACEPFINGMAAFLKTLDESELPQDNIRVLMDDAILLVDALPDNAIDRIYVLNPDPWPKSRHHKRRIISPENLDRFARIMAPGAQLIMTTDVDDLAEWMVLQASRHPAFTWTAESQQDWHTPPPDWQPTRYEQKGIKAGRRQSYFVFERVE